MPEPTDPRADAEYRRLLAESDKFQAEQRKLSAEAQKLFVEGLKIERERRWLVPLALISNGALAAAIGAVVAKLVH
jgi:hypothetical protein